MYDLQKAELSDADIAKCFDCINHEALLDKKSARSLICDQSMAQN